MFTVSADLAVGAVEETITVSGETPVVNLQTTTRQAVMDQEIVSAIPSSRTPFTTGVLIPGVRRGATMSQDVGGSVVQEVASLEANGGRQADQRLMVNGVALSSMIGGGWGGGAVPNATGTAEFAIDVSAVDAQAATGGVRINFIPRDGGNRYSGTIFGSYAGEDFASDNFTGTDVQERGLSTPGRIKANGDFNPGFGGPIKRDQLWFFISARALFADNFVPGMFFNQNVNQLNRYDYVASSDQAILHQEQKIIQGRFTWQVNQKNKIGVTADFEEFCACTTGITAGVAPEAGVDRRFPLQRFVTIDWTTPLSSKLLVEVSAIHRVERWGGMHPQEGKLGNIDGLTPGMIGILDNPSRATGASLSYRANTGAGAYNNSWNWNLHYRAAVLVHHRVAQLQGGGQQRLRPLREHQLHRPVDAVLLRLRQRHPQRDQLSPPAADGRRQRESRPRAVRAGQVDDRAVDPGGRRALRHLQEQLPAAGDRGDVLRAQPEHQLRHDRQRLLARHHAEAGGHV